MDPSNSTTPERELLRRFIQSGCASGHEFRKAGADTLLVKEAYKRVRPVLEHLGGFERWDTSRGKVQARIMVGLLWSEDDQSREGRLYLTHCGWWLVCRTTWDSGNRIQEEEVGLFMDTDELVAFLTGKKGIQYGPLNVFDTVTGWHQDMTCVVQAMANMLKVHLKKARERLHTNERVLAKVEQLTSLID